MARENWGFCKVTGGELGEVVRVTQLVSGFGSGPPKADLFWLYSQGELRIEDVCCRLFWSCGAREDFLAFPRAGK